MQQKDFISDYLAKGFRIFHTQARDKKVFTKWTEYQHRAPTEREIQLWRGLPFQNWAIICGEVSGIIVYDVDTKNGGDPTPFQNRGFYEVRTPSGGYHFYAKYTEVLKSTKHNKEYKGILKGVDIQSNQSLVFAPPSYFPDKGGYTLVNDVPLIDTPPDLLASILEALEPEQEATHYTPYIGPKNPEQGRPGDIFNALMTWDEVLIPLGWRKYYTTSNNTTFWTRPGKDDRSISASTNWRGYDLFFPYTTSVSGLEPKKGYTKFTLLAHLKFDGDFAKTAKALVLENYNLIVSKI